MSLGRFAMRGAPRVACTLALVSLAFLGATNAAAEADTLRSIADEIYAWRLEREPGMRLKKGLPITRFEALDEASTRERAAFARSVQARLSQLDARSLPHQEDLFRQSLMHAMRMDADAEPFHWLTFLVTPYQGGDIHQLVFQVLGAQQIQTPADAENYLALVRDYGRVLDDIYNKTTEQQRRGLLVSKAAIPGVLQLCAGLRDGAGRSLIPEQGRLPALAPTAARQFKAELQSVVSKRILPAIERLEAVFDSRYRAAAPDGVGLSLYPQGAGFYRHLIQAYTGLDLSADPIHETGTKALAQIDAELDEIRAASGFKGTREEFHASLKSDPRWIAHTPEEVERRYTAFVHRIEPHLKDYFSRLPKAPYGVKRLDAAAEPGMTYGYYQPPSAADPEGYYRYNGSELATRTMIGAQHLIYHELVPGHHFQIALGQERTDVHPLQAFLASTAYVEGWAEYAASLAEDMNLYEPMDRYGHLMMRSFIATRLVVDTGMNAKGWTLDRARQAMLHGTLEGDRQIESELLRYSTDIPAQALAYYLGYEKMKQLRERAQRELGKAFDLRAFDDALLSCGPLPLEVLESHVDWYIGEARKSGAMGSSQHIAAVNTAKVQIRRPPSQVWKALFDRTGWMPSFVSRQRLRGQVDSAGEESLYELRDSEGRPGQRLEEILLAAPNERLVIRLAPPDGHGTSAIGEYRLTRARGGTELEFNVYWWEDITQPSTPEQLQTTEDLYVRATGEKIRGDLERLKRFLESRH